MQVIFSIIIFFSAILHLIGKYYKKPVLNYLFKPVTTILIIILAFLLPDSVSIIYKSFIIVGLFFSLLGDIFLMLPKNKFIHGLISFFIAHILFIIAIISDFGPYFDWQYLIPILLYLIIILKIILPHTGKIKLPVIFYTIIISFFLWQAAGRAYYLADNSSIMAFLGALAFIISDSVLAYNKFVKSFKLAEIIIMLTYWGALYLLTLSL